MIERIQKLEQSNKRLKKYLISLHVILVGMFIVGFQSSGVSDLIETKKLVIKDDNGEDRITLSIDQDYSIIRMSKDSNESIRLSSSGSENFLWLYNPKGGTFLTNLGMDNSLVMRDKERKEEYIMSTSSGFGGYGKQRFNLELFGGEPRLEFYSNKLNKTLSLSSIDEKSNISLFDTFGNTRVSIGNQDLIDPNGNKYTTPISSINLFDQNNKTIYSAPR